jgi:hypothetical protein
MFLNMKYKISALILGLTFAGVSQAGVLSFTYTLGTNIFTRTSDNANTGTFLSGDSLSNFIPTSPVTITNMQTGTSQTQTLYTVTYTPNGGTNATSTITATDTMTISSPASTPTAYSFITAAFLDSVSGGDNTTLSDTMATTQSRTFVFDATGYRLTVTPLQFASFGPSTVDTAVTITVAATFALAAPEPGTWMLLGSSLIGLGLLARRRKIATLS